MARRALERWRNPIASPPQDTGINPAAWAMVLVGAAVVLGTVVFFASGTK